MGAFTDVVKILFLPALIASALYLLLAHLLLPLLRAHRSRYDQYLPVGVSGRASDFLTRLTARRHSNGRSGRDSSDGDLFGDEEGETMVGFDYRRREREVRGGRVEDTWSDGRLSRELEEGFKDDSEDEGEGDERRGRGQGRE